MLPIVFVTFMEQSDLRTQQYDLLDRWRKQITCLLFKTNDDTWNRMFSFIDCKRKKLSLFNDNRPNKMSSMVDNKPKKLFLMKNNKPDEMVL